MILIERWPPNDKGYVNTFVSVKLGSRWIKPDFAFQRYVAGQGKPNYPVPAIRLCCHIYHDKVILMQCGITLMSGYFSKTINKAETP